MGHHHNPVSGFQDRWPNVSLFHLVLLQYRPAIQVKPFCFPLPFAAILNAILIALCSSWTMFFTYIWLYWSDRGYVVIIGSSTTISKLGNNFRCFLFLFKFTAIILFTHFQSYSTCHSCVQSVDLLFNFLVQWIHNLHNPWWLSILGQPGASPQKVKWRILSTSNLIFAP